MSGRAGKTIRIGSLIAMCALAVTARATDQ